MSDQPLPPQSIDFERSRHREGETPSGSDGSPLLVAHLSSLTSRAMAAPFHPEQSPGSRGSLTTIGS
jgi:hypothetical protein